MAVVVTAVLRDETYDALSFVNNMVVLLHNHHAPSHAIG